MNEKLKKLLSFRTILILGIIACFCCIIPFSRALIISLMEFLMHRPLRDVHKWDDILIHSMAFFAVIQVFWLFFCYTGYGRRVYTSISGTVVTAFTREKTKKQLLVLFIIYFICFWAIIRANYEYADDIRRVYAGHKAWVGWSRYVSETLAVFLHTNFFINDISPVGQLWAVIVLTVMSYLLASIVMDGKVTRLSLIAATAAGLCPFFIVDFSYKFDCPYMALAMLFGVFPFLFINKRPAYIFVSFISLLLVCTSYQAANSIYILLTIYTAWKMWSQKESWKNIGIYSGISILCYAAALIFFRLFLMNTFEGNAVSRGTGIALGGGMFSVIARNFSEYVSAITSGYGNLWIKAFTIIALLLFPFAAARRTARNKYAAAGFSVIVLILMFSLSFGAYLVLEQALISARTFMGFDIFIALIVLTDVAGAADTKSFKKLSGAVVVLLVYGLCINATVNGNLYSKQKEYDNFRFTILLQDLSHIITPQAQNSIYIGGIPGPAGKTRMERKNYRIEGGHQSPVLTQYLIKDWNMDFKFLSEDTLEELDLQPELKTKLTDLPLIEDTYYHTIYGKDNQYYVYLKNPQIKE
jgi:hypothetical protein